MTRLTVNLKRLPHGADLPLPDYATSQSAAVDLQAAIDGVQVIAPGKRAMIETGIAIALPAGFEAQVRPRSGLAAKNGVTVLNSPGTIDADYRGEIKVILINHGDAAFEIERGMRIAQLVVAPVTQVAWQAVDDLDETARGSGGFGSTGTKGAVSA
ncbi:dUTP diphosphatase [Thalassospira sp. GB04J01]|uniref:dUTP diphosphatase n=1 Tax=Thalassospira sp. GB04J01 TaxID=1485225 RepID=UPI000C9C56D1|nr:dUTP diphosphatase [Thalassospira sp. GB04J01]|tara:strand:- start:26328 stop:26795 length:468 start_codon:yes stop_codon:yes gene_type:complete